MVSADSAPRNHLTAGSRLTQVTFTAYVDLLSTLCLYLIFLPISQAFIIISAVEFPITDRVTIMFTPRDIGSDSEFDAWISQFEHRGTVGKITFTIEPEPGKLTVDATSLIEPITLGYFHIEENTTLELSKFIVENFDKFKFGYAGKDHILISPENIAQQGDAGYSMIVQVDPFWIGTWREFTEGSVNLYALGLAGDFGGIIKSVINLLSINTEGFMTVRWRAKEFLSPSEKSSSRYTLTRLYHQVTYQNVELDCNAQGVHCIGPFNTATDNDKINREVVFQKLKTIDLPFGVLLVSGVFGTLAFYVSLYVFLVLGYAIRAVLVIIPRTLHDAIDIKLVRQHSVACIFAIGGVFPSLIIAYLR